MTKLSYNLINRRTKELVFTTTDYHEALDYQSKNKSTIEIEKVFTPIPNFYKKDKKTT